MKNTTNPAALAARLDSLCARSRKVAAAAYFPGAAHWMLLIADRIEITVAEILATPKADRVAARNGLATALALAFHPRALAGDMVGANRARATCAEIMGVVHEPWI